MQQRDKRSWAFLLREWCPERIGSDVDLPGDLMSKTIEVLLSGDMWWEKPRFINDVRITAHLFKCHFELQFRAAKNSSLTNCTQEKAPVPCNSNNGNKSMCIQ